MSVELAKHEPIIKSRPDGIVENVCIEATAEALRTELQKRGFTQGNAVLWEMQDVLWGRVQDGRLSFPKDEGTNPIYWQEIRVFHGAAELHLTRQGEKLAGRYRADEGGDTSIEYVDAISRLWGERDEDQSGVPADYVRLTDQGRGSAMVVPFDGALGQWCGLVTRNYVETDRDTWQAGYTDMRFVSLVDADMKGA